MSFFNEGNKTLDNDMSMITEDFMQAHIENVFFAETAALPDDQRKSFLESEEVVSLQEKGLIGRKTFVKLSKMDDLERRAGMAAIQMAKENNDILYKQLVALRVKERKILTAIDRKYANKATRVAKAAQKSYITANPIGSSYGVAGGSAATSQGAAKPQSTGGFKLKFQ